MDIGRPIKAPYVVEPLVDPVPRRPGRSTPAPDAAPVAPAPVHAPEKKEPVPV